MRNYTTSIVEIESAFKTGLHVWPVFKFRRELTLLFKFSREIYNISDTVLCPLWIKKIPRMNGTNKSKTVGLIKFKRNITY